MKMLTITTPAGDVLGIPVDVIARNRAAHYAPLEFDGDIERSLKEDTLPLFESDDFEIADWASNNMNWSDVAPYSRKLRSAPPANMQEAWISGPKEIIDVAE